MKTPAFFVPRFAHSHFAQALFFSLILGTSGAHAADAAWAAVSTDANWSTGANWTGGSPGNTSSGATATTDVATFSTVVSGGFGGSGSPLVTDAGRTIFGMTFTGSAGSYVVGSTATTLYLSSSGIIQKTGSASNQTVNAALRIMGANATYTLSNTYVNSASLVFGGGISGGTAGATVLTLDGTNTSTANRVNGVIANGTSTSLALVKNGTGAWGLANNNTFTGGVTLNAGTLYIRHAGALGTGTFTITGGTFDNNTGSALANTRNNAQAWNGDFTFTGSGDYNIGTGTVTLGATRTVTTGGSTFTVGGVIGGGGFGLTKAGAGTMVLGGNNTYTGATTVNAGTLALGAADRIANSSALVLGGGTFATGGFGETLGMLTLNASSTLDFGAGASALVFDDSHSIAWTGTLTLLNFDIGTDSLKFGTSISALTLAQLNSISLAGYTASLDSSGFVTFSAIPEPSTYAMFAGASTLALAAFRRRRG